jgi:hypothetical protein
VAGVYLAPDDMRTCLGDLIAALSVPLSSSIAMPRLPFECSFDLARHCRRWQRVKQAWVDNLPAAVNSNLAKRKQVAYPI